jgi:hypothetical protein
MQPNRKSPSIDDKNSKLEENRAALLLKMYDQMFSDINRHILVVWQSIGVVIAAFAVFSLTEKHTISIHVASGLIILLCAWLIAHLYDASYWYNRNLIIIANIERQFLLASDLKDIHSYFGKHRKPNKIITHLRIQYFLAVGLVMLVLGSHLFNQVIPMGRSICSVDGLQLVLPYVTLLGAIIYLVWLQKDRRHSYSTFLNNSPGKSVESADIDFNGTHGQ